MNALNRPGECGESKNVIAQLVRKIARNHASCTHARNHEKSVSNTADTPSRPSFARAAGVVYGLVESTSFRVAGCPQGSV